MTIDAFDIALAVATVALAWQTVFCRDLYEAVVYFIALGLAVALAWARLDAPDVAIAEAAIGAGLTGALLVSTWRRLGQTSRSADTAPSAMHAVVATTVAGALAALVGYVLALSPDDASLTAAVAAQMPSSGVEHPVTAVLLNFRSLDTLLEIGVLFLILAAVRALGVSWSVPPLEPTHSTMLNGLVSLVVPLAIVIGAYLLWVGATAPGGAFQAGAVWAGALVLLRLAGSPLIEPFHRNELVALGLGVFAVAALTTHALSGVPLKYPPGSAGAWILVIEIAAAVAIATILYRLFAADPTRSARP